MTSTQTFTLVHGHGRVDLHMSTRSLVIKEFLFLPSCHIYQSQYFFEALQWNLDREMKPALKRDLDCFIICVI